MSAVLLRWVNSLGLSVSVSTLEDAFASGALLAEILASKCADKKNHAPLQDTDDLQGRLENFEQLEKRFATIGFAPDRALLGKVILEDPGAAANLLFHLKCKLEPESRPRKYKEMVTGKETREEVSARRENQHRSRKPQEDTQIEMARRGKLTAKQMDCALHNAKFDQRRVQHEVDIMRMEEDELARVAEAIEKQRKGKIKRLRENREFLTEWIKAGRKTWKANQRVKRERQHKELQHELTCKAIAEARVAHQNNFHSEEVEIGTAAFERNMKRLGVGEEEDVVERDDTPTLAVASPANQSLSKKERLQLMEKKVLDAIEVGKQQDDHLISRIRTQRLEIADGRKSREQRRRKIAYDQNQLQRQAEEKLKNEALLSKLIVEGKLEREVARKLREQKMAAQERRGVGQLFVENAIKERTIAFQNVLIADRKRWQGLKDTEGDVKSKEEKVGEGEEEEEEKEEKEVEEGEEEKMDQAQSEESSSNQRKKRKKERALDLANDTVLRIVALVVATAEERMAGVETDGKPNRLSPEIWRNLKRSFVDGSLEPLLPPQNRLTPVELEEKMTNDPTIFPHAQETRDWIRNLESESVSQTNFHFRILESPVSQVQDKLSTLRNALSGQEPIPSLPFSPMPQNGTVILGSNSHLSKCCGTMLKYRFGAKIFSKANYVEEALRWKEAQDEELTGGTPPPTDNKKKMAEKVDISSVDRESLLLALAAAVVPSDANGSAFQLPSDDTFMALVRLVAFDLTHSKPPYFVLQDIISSRDQAIALEYMLLPEQDRMHLSFDQFVKADSAKSAESPVEQRLNKSLSTLVSLDNTIKEDGLSQWLKIRVRATFLAEQEQKSSEEEEEKPENIKHLLQSIQNQINGHMATIEASQQIERDEEDGRDNELKEGIDRDGEVGGDNEAKEAMDLPKEQTLTSMPESIQIDGHAAEENEHNEHNLNTLLLLRDHLEAVELPENVGRRLNLDAISTLHERLCEAIGLHQRQAEHILHSVLSGLDAGGKEADQIVSVGVNLIRGLQPPPNILTLGEVKEQIFAAWNKFYQTSRSHNVENLEEIVDKLGKELWTASLEYNRLCRSVLEKWAEEELWTTWSNLLSEQFEQLVDIEQDLYLSLRTIFKEFYRTVEQGSSCETEDNVESARSTSEADLNQIIDVDHVLQGYESLATKLKGAMRSIAIREKREFCTEGSVDSTYHQTLCWLNFYFRTRLVDIAKKAGSMINKLQPGFEGAFSTLKKCGKEKLVHDDKNIREMVNRSKYYIRSEIASVSFELAPLKYLSNEDSLNEIVENFKKL